MLDFKIRAYRVRDDGGIIARIAVYRGEITTENESVRGEFERVAPVTRYRRTNFLGEKTFQGENRAEIITKVKSEVRSHLRADEEIEEKSEAV